MISPKKKCKIIKELTAFVNSHSMENECNTPDFVIAEMLYSHYEAFCKAVISRDRWYDFNPWEKDE